MIMRRAFAHAIASGLLADLRAGKHRSGGNRVPCDRVPGAQWLGAARRALGFREQPAHVGRDGWRFRW
jgi:hypothetical protein